MFGTSSAVDPVPLIGMVTGEFTALLDTNVKAAVRVPAAWGAKTTCTVQALFGENDDWQLLLWLKSPESAPEIVTVTGSIVVVPLFLTDTCPASVNPANRLGKIRPDGAPSTSMVGGIG
jgi:hypothetical protein